ncbi:DUF3293 domain-containing protein [Corallococcus praedator]|uniref:DUF3293 domain-containing protein n=1 Tax=Corallococcus praedator TaxID=2316724 RepID=A0ABX9QQL8_9BACT|nr:MULTISPECIES: DUF3293 domain-containing protein [Corallococcus]RKH20853.1 DUF3293 domain-containing protein [Corallococcus sp. CA047B]RKH35407.1 DUF3293 domain-containing protein [Corallococcus sp. CA031C]RKI15712.1 DUF3293 domain-containing protein [Corallococcus praedator]
MHDEPADPLRKAFESTGYVVRAHPLVGGVKHVLRVGATHPLLDAALTAHGHTSWAFLTAWNPHARAHGSRTNARLQRTLRGLLEARGHHPVSAVGVADDRSWFEESLFVPGMSRDEARHLGGLLRQKAVLQGRVGGVAELLWCQASALP